MELYISACSKAADVAATKTATSGLTTESQQCGDGERKTEFSGVGAAQLLDLPLGVKLPVIPGSNSLYYTTKLNEKLFRPSYGFNLTDPYCRLLENQYKSLHDPHLRAYHKRKDILRRLKKGGYITSNNKVVCTLRELNKYRQYLTSLKLDFERNYIREQKMLAKQVNKLREDNQIPGRSDVTQFQNWLLQEGTPSIKDQEQLIRHRYLDMIKRELEHLEHTAEEQRLLRMDREERRQREHARRKLSLRRKIEEEWKTKEMLLLTRIGEDVKREARIEEQRRKSREETNKKKQALLEKKMAYHLQKMQESGIKKEDMRKNTNDYGEKDGLHYESIYPKKKKKKNDDIKVVYAVADQKPNRGADGPCVNTLQRSLSSSKNIAKKPVPAVVCQPDAQDDTEKKKDGKASEKSSVFDDRGEPYFSTQDSVISPQNSAIRNFPRSSMTYLNHSKVEKEINVDWNGRSKRPSLFCKPGLQASGTTPGIFPSCVFSNTQQHLLQNCLQEKAVCRNSFQNIRKPDITKVELLKDVQNKKELILRLVAHDIEQEISESTIEEELTSSDEDEVVLREIVQEHSGENIEDQVKHSTKTVESKVVSPKPTQSTSSLKKFFSLSKCCQPTSNANVENTGTVSNHVIEAKNGQIKRTVAELDMSPCSGTFTETDSTWEEKSQSKKEEKILITEPTHYFIHRIMSSSSYNQEDLISYASETEDYIAERTKILEASSQEQKPENSNSVKFITIFEGNKNILHSVNPSKEVISETSRSDVPKQGSKMLAKVSSALSKVFSRNINTNISKSSSPPHQSEH